MQALAEQSRIVRLPLNRVGSLTKIAKTFSDLEQKFQREPIAEELAEVIGVTTQEVLDNQKVSGRHVSIDAPFSQADDSNSLMDVLYDANETMPDTGMVADSLKMEVQRSLSTLPEREAQVLRLYFGLNGEEALTLDEISQQFNLTRERVRQLKEKATRRLQNTRSKTLKSYLG